MGVSVYVTSPLCCASHEVQFTYNYTPLLREIGMPAWKYLDGLQADVVAIMVGRTQLELMVHRSDERSKLEALIRGGGEWGTMDTLLASLGDLLGHLDRHARDGVVRVS